MGTLEGRVCVVTGGGRGIGASVSRLLAAEGAAVVVNDLGVSVDGNMPDDLPAKQVVDQIVTAGGRAVPNYDNVADEEAAENIIRQALNEYGRLDVLINVAGILRDRMVFNMPKEDWDSVVSVHMAPSTRRSSPPSTGGRRKRATTGSSTSPLALAFSGRRGSRTMRPRRWASLVSRTPVRMPSRATG